MARGGVAPCAEASNKAAYSVSVQSRPSDSITSATYKISIVIRGIFYRRKEGRNFTSQTLKEVIQTLKAPSSINQESGILLANLKFELLCKNLKEENQTLKAPSNINQELWVLSANLKYELLCKNLKAKIWTLKAPSTFPHSVYASKLGRKVRCRGGTFATWPSSAAWNDSSPSPPTRPL